MNSFFGEIGFFTGLKRTAMARSKSYTVLFKISREEVLTLLENFPEEKVYTIYFFNIIIFYLGKVFSDQRYYSII